ncbi:MAG: DUF3119 family protein [Cyanobacteria bacterium J06554_11]
MTQTSTGTVTLDPNYRLSVGIVLFALPLLFAPWIVVRSLSLVIALLGLFLIYQTTAIELVFTPTALDVRRNGSPLRTFPYAEWESWKIFWSPAPILFYFKEVNSIHFVPILYSPVQLRSQLEARCPDRAV